MDCISTNKTRKNLYRIISGWMEKRYYNHRKLFQNQRYQLETMLSCYVWEIKRAIDQISSMKWLIIKVLPGYSNITKRWQLCLYEKNAVITYPDLKNLLNKRSEIMSKCPHQRKFLLSNYITCDWNPDLINFVNCWNNWFHQKKLLEAPKRKCIWEILLLELNNLLFGQFTVYRLNNLLLEWFTVKCLNTLMFKQLTKIDTLMKLYINLDNNKGARSYKKTNFSTSFNLWSFSRKFIWNCWNYENYKLDMKSDIIFKMVISQLGSDLTATVKNKCLRT